MSLLVLWGSEWVPSKGANLACRLFQAENKCNKLKRRVFFFLPSYLPKEILIEKLASWREPQHIHLCTYKMRVADREDSSINLFARFPSVSGWSCKNLFTKCLLLPIYWWIAYLPLLGPKWHIYLSFCLTVFAIFMLTWISPIHVLKFDFFLVIVHTSFESFDLQK